MSFDSCLTVDTCFGIGTSLCPMVKHASNKNVYSSNYESIFLSILQRIYSLKKFGWPHVPAPPSIQGRRPNLNLLPLYNKLKLFYEHTKHARRQKEIKCIRAILGERVNKFAVRVIKLKDTRYSHR